MVTFISALKEKKKKMLASLVSLSNCQKKQSSCTVGGKSTQAYILVLTMTPKGVLSPQSPITVIRDTVFSFHNPLWILLLESPTNFLESTYKTAELLLGSSADKESSCNAGDLGSIPGLGRSPGEGNGNQLQYSGLESSMDSIVYGVTKSRMSLSDFHFLGF